MDSLLESDIERTRMLPPEERLRQALDTMDAGLRIKRRALRASNRELSEEELGRLMVDWLLAGD